MVIDKVGTGFPIAGEWASRPACFRGFGIGKALLAAVEAEARPTGCCRVSLEAQEKNRTACSLYEAHGFAQAVYGPETGGSLGYRKRL